MLDVPVCKVGKQNEIGVAKSEVIKVNCEVEANPRDVQFLWKFNNTLHDIEITPSIVDRTRSVLTYIPQSQSDYGTILCWARNELGQQKVPCVFQIIPYGKHI